MAPWSTLLGVCCLALGTYPLSCTARPQQKVHFNASQLHADVDAPHAFVILGASGDLSKREIYPALWSLYRDNKLPSNTRFYGHARKNIDVAKLRENVDPYVKISDDELKRYDEFWSLNKYTAGTDNEDADYDKINEMIGKDQGGPDARGNRIFYLALPPSVFQNATTQIKRACMAKKGWTRIGVEKPFGHDLASSEELSHHLSSLFTEDQIYRMDHFLGYDMVQNLLRIRFANRMFDPSWNKHSIASVKINFCENMGIEGRGVFFDENGIIRDVMQNHLLQIMSLIAMEKPVSASSDDVRDAKVELLKSTKAVVMDDVVLGQYVGNPDSDDPRERIGFQDDPTVPPGSNASTFALTVLRIQNQRWEGVPFIIRAGKGLDVNKTEVIIQYKGIENDIFNGQSNRNELIIRIGTTEALQVKLMSKIPGFSSNIEEITMDFDYINEYKDLKLPSAYEVLLLDMFHGNQMNFVREDELKEAWKIFTPILHEIEGKQIKPIDYKFGSKGPQEADELEVKNNFL
ncbi:hypothetical protein QAD02_015070 [Eretmocerus hayati]|uniref:Uncharacterized protein n=1 Tax=Eretmocerus hayati TaxID=131215 RepID=A0ACC2P7A8_9HYME|nr:hypothetical protein QAD02_015070 [Eretmocerus hayati]